MHVYNNQVVVNTFVEVKYDFLYYYNYMPFSHRCRIRLKWPFYHFKRYLILTSFIIRRMQIKTTLRYNFSPIIIAKTQMFSKYSIGNDRLMGMQNGMPTREGSLQHLAPFDLAIPSLNLLLSKTGTSKTHHCSTTCSNSVETILIPAMDTLNKPWYTDTMRYNAVVNR